MNVDPRSEPNRGVEATASSGGLERKAITVLFADIKGSTSLIENIDAEEALSLLRPVVDLMADTIERFSGVVVQRLGDGLMAVFGLPFAIDDHAEVACRSALAMQAALSMIKTNRADIQVRIGLNSGPAVVETFGEGDRVTYRITGFTVHIAQRMESVAPPGGICVTEATRRSARSAFEFESLGLKHVKGASKPIPSYVLVRARSNEPGTTARSEQGAFVGRSDELAKLRERLATLEPGNGSIALIVGDAGIGKTRLIDELQRSSSETRLHWLRGQAVSFGHRLSYWPFMEALANFFAREREGKAPLDFAALERMAAPFLGTETAETLPYIATLLSVEVSAPHRDKVQYLDGESFARQILRSMRRFFELLAQTRPVVLVFEDLHWLDSASAELLEHLLLLATSSPIMFCLALRSEDDGTGSRIRELAHRLYPDRCLDLTLYPLSLAESAKLVSSIADRGDPSPMPERLRDFVLQKSAGNPFFIEEVVRSIRERPEITAQELYAHIPDTIQGVIMSRVDRLDQELRDVLMHAAVIGRSFIYRLLEAITERGRDLDARLSELDRIKLIEERRRTPELEYLFRHALAQEAIYDSILLQRRRQLHDRVASWLEALYPDRLDEISGALAFHFVRAENWERALHYLLAAGEQASRLAADEEALQNYELAVAAYGKVFGKNWDRLQRAHIERRLAEIYFRRGEHDRASEHVNVGLALFDDPFPVERGQLRRAIARELLRQVLHRAMPGCFVTPARLEIGTTPEAHFRLYEALVWSDLLVHPERMLYGILRTANLAERTGYFEAQAKAYSALGFAAGIIGFGRIALYYHRKALSIADTFAHPTTQALSYDLLGLNSFYRGEWLDALAHLTKAQEVAWGAGDLVIWSDASVIKCELLSELGALGEAQALAEQMSIIGREAAYGPARRWGTYGLGRALLRRGETVAALDPLEAAFADCTAARDLITMAASGGELGSCLIALGRHTEAHEVLTRTLAEITENHVNVHTVVFTYNATAELALATPGVSPNEALASCRRALRKTRHFAVGQPGALRLLARAHLRGGQRRRAENLWRRAISIAARLGAKYELTQCHAEIGEHLNSAEDRRLASSIRAGMT